MFDYVLQIHTSQSSSNILILFILEALCPQIGYSDLIVYIINIAQELLLLILSVLQTEKR